MSRTTAIDLTVQTIPSDILFKIEASKDPLSSDTDEQVSKQLNLLRLYHGVRELREDPEGLKKAESLLSNHNLGDQMIKLMVALFKVNPPQAERIDNLIITMAFAPEETKLLAALMDAGARQEVAKLISGEEDLISAVSVCRELFMVFGTAANLASSGNVTIDHAMLVLAKPVLKDRNLLTAEELKKLPDPPQPNVNLSVN